MVKYLVIILVSMGFLLLPVGCKSSRKELCKSYMSILQDRINRDPEYIEYNLKVRDLRFVKKNDTQYKGLAKIEYRGFFHYVPVAFTVNKESITWDMDPQYLTFLAR